MVHVWFRVKGITGVAVWRRPGSKAGVIWGQVETGGGAGAMVVLEEGTGKGRQDLLVGYEKGVRSGGPEGWQGHQTKQKNLPVNFHSENALAVRVEILSKQMHESGVQRCDLDRKRESGGPGTQMV